MSITNGERLVTKQDLADMYQGILPYLGGMPEVLANKFSKGDMYSTDEKMIGQWVDGKPLYQRMVEFTTPVTIINANEWTKLDDVSSIAQIINTIIYRDNGEGNHYGVVCTPSQVNISNNAIYVTFPTGQINNIYGYLFQYTKSTDSAISIGDDTDYSTEEKIVGTWIDGKPVYQKTFQTIMPTVVEDGKTTTGDRISIGADVEHFIDIRGMAYSAQSYYIIPDSRLMNESSPQTGSYIMRFALNNYSASSEVKNTFSIKSNYATLNGCSVVVTVQYTKTTT